MSLLKELSLLEPADLVLRSQTSLLSLKNDRDLLLPLPPSFDLHLHLRPLSVLPNRRCVLPFPNLLLLKVHLRVVLLDHFRTFPRVVRLPQSLLVSPLFTFKNRLPIKEVLHSLLLRLLRLSPLTHTILPTLDGKVYLLPLLPTRLRRSNPLRIVELPFYQFIFLKLEMPLCNNSSTISLDNLLRSRYETLSLLQEVHRLPLLPQQLLSVLRLWIPVLLLPLRHPRWIMAI